MNRAARERQGRRAETWAAWWLRLHGWRILEQRLRTPVGEIDILARRGRVVACIEVKYRETVIELDHAIDRARLRRVAAAAGLICDRHLGPQDELRIDVILISPWNRPRHLVNVWHG
jgi:putative endonuclease